MAVYEVKSPEGKTTLVECRTSKAAINHVASKGFTTTTLKMGDVVKRVKAGEQIESIEEDQSPQPQKSSDVASVSDTQAGVTTAADLDETKPSSFAGRFTKKSA